MEGLVSDYGDAAVVREMFFYFCWSFRLLYCKDEGVRRVMRDKLLYEVKRWEDQQTVSFVFLNEFGLDARLPGAYEGANYALVVRANRIKHGYLTISEGLCRFH
jgi:hypothetical protein